MVVMTTSAHGLGGRFRFAATTLATAAALVGAVAGCGTERGPGRSGAMTTGAGVFGWAAPAGVPNPVEALDLAGITIPPDAQFQKTSTQGLDEHTMGYLFVFRIDPEGAHAFCDQDGLGGARGVSELPMRARESFGNVSVTDASRWCAGAAPKDPTWLRYALIDPGTPSTVHLSIQHQIA